jgi:amino acid transporter
VPTGEVPLASLVKDPIHLGGLALAAVIGIAALTSGIGEPGRAIEFKEGTPPMLAVLAGAALAFYALIGFEDSVNIAEETTARSAPIPSRCLIRPCSFYWASLSP